MILDSKPYNFDKVFRIIVTILSILGTILLLNYLRDVLIPFFLAFLLAYLINPFTLKLQKKTGNRVVAVALSLGSIFLVVSLIAVILTPILGGELQEMGMLLKKIVSDSQMTKKAQEFLPAEVWLWVRDHLNKDAVVELLQNRNYWEIIQSFLKRLLPGAIGILSGTKYLLILCSGLFLVVLYLVFILIDFQKVQQEWEDLIPVKLQKPLVQFLKDFDDAMSRYFRGQAMIAGIVGVLFATAFSIIGLPMGILLGLFIGLLNMVPYLQVIAILPALFLGFIHAIDAGSSPVMTMLMVLAVFGIVQLIQDAFLTPKIMGNITGFSPAMILLSVSVWGKILGFLGLIIAIPITCLVMAYYKKINST